MLAAIPIRPGPPMRHSFLGILVALCVSACASAPTVPPAAAAPATEPATATAPQPVATDDAAKPQEVASADDSKELICQDEPITGTHVRRTRRVCATAEEWARRREENQKALQSISNRAGQSNP